MGIFVPGYKLASQMQYGTTDMLYSYQNTYEITSTHICCTVLQIFDVYYYATFHLTVQHF